MKTNHTPGPWRTFGYEVGPSKRNLICTLYMQSGNSVGLCADVTKANARLIALAPELLEALSGLYASICRVEGTEDKYQCIASKAQLADAYGIIAKATSRKTL